MDNKSESILNKYTLNFIDKKIEKKYKMILEP